MPTEIGKQAIEQITVEDAYKQWVAKFTSQMSKIARSEISSHSIIIHLNSIFELLTHYNLDTGIRVKPIINEAIRDFNEFKTLSLDKLNKSIDDNLDTLVNNSTTDPNDENTKRLLQFNTNVDQKKEDFKKASSIVDAVSKFINSSSKLKQLEGQHKKAKKRDVVKNTVFGGLAAITGLPIVAGIPKLWEDGKKIKKDFKNADKKTKMYMALQGMALTGGVLTGSPGAIFGASILEQEVNKNKQINSNLNQTILSNNNTIRNDSVLVERNGGEFSLNSLTSEDADEKLRPASSRRRTTPNTNQLASLHELSPIDRYDLEELKKKSEELNATPADIDAYKKTKNRYKGAGYNVAGLAHGTRATGGDLETTAPTKIGGGMVAGENGAETIKVIPKGKDPVVTELEKTNELLIELVQSNKDMLEDQAEENARKGLSNKDTKAEKTETDIFGNKKEDKKDPKKDDKKHGFMDNLTDRGINKAGNALGKIPVVGKLLGGVVSSMSDATPVYVVNASDIGGGALDGVGKTVGKTVGAAGMGLGGTAALAVGGALATAGVVAGAILLTKKILDDTGINAKLEKDGKKRQEEKTKKEAADGTTAAVQGRISDNDKAKAEALKAGKSEGEAQAAGTNAQLYSKQEKGFSFWDYVKGGTGYETADKQAAQTQNVSAPVTPTEPVTDKKKSSIFGGWFAEGGSFVADQPTIIGVGEKGKEQVTVSPMGAENVTPVTKTDSSVTRTGNAPLNVVIKEDKSKLGKEQLSLLKKSDKAQKEDSALIKTEIQLGSAKADAVKAEEDTGAVKADEEKTLAEKLSSIWSDPSKSTLSKVGGSVGSTFSSIGSGIGGIFKSKKSEFDISKLAEGTGSVAAKYESGGAGAGTISSGKGDFGGKSYGTHQFTGGALQSFIKSSSHAKEFEGLTKGTPEFDAAWKNAAKDPNFAKEQHDQISKTHAAPQMDKLKKLGLNTDSKALQEMAFSTGVQYGPASGIIEEAIKASGKDASKLSTKEIIEIVQDYKASTVGQKFKSSSGAVQAGVAKRHGVNEKADLLKIAQAEEDGTLGGKPKVAENTPPKVEKKQGFLSKLFGAKEASAADLPKSISTPSNLGAKESADTAKVQPAPKTKKKSVPAVTSVAPVAPIASTPAVAASNDISVFSTTDKEVSTASPANVSPSGGISPTAIPTESGLSVGGNASAGTGDGIKKSGNVDLSKVNDGFESNFEGMASEYKAQTGKDIQVNSGYRDSDKQAKLYAENLQQYPPNGNGKVAKPGRSPHEKGLAIDINSGDANTADKLGLLDKWRIARPLLNHPRIPEAWHLQPAGVATASYPTLQSGGGAKPVIKSAGGSGGGTSDVNKEQGVYTAPVAPVPIATKKEASPIMAQTETGMPTSKTASVKPKTVQEGSIANIKNNSSQGSEGTALKNKEVATDASASASASQGTQQAINNISIGGSAPTPPAPQVTIYTGDQISYATRLAKSY